MFWLYLWSFTAQVYKILYINFGCVIILTFAMQLQLASCSTEDWVKVRNWAWCHNISSYSLQHTAKNYKIKLLLTIWAKHNSLIWRDPYASWLIFWQNIMPSPGLQVHYVKVLTTYQTTNCSNSYRQKHMFLWNFGYYIPNYTMS